MKRARMTPQRWASLSAFPWAVHAQNLWDTLSERQRWAVVRAALAEQAADVAYLKAEKALGQRQ